MRAAERDAPPLLLGSLAALYVLWGATWLVLGDQAFGPANANWDQALVAALAAAAAFIKARHTRPPYRLFLAVMGSGLFLLALSWAVYQDGGPLRFSGEGAPSYSAVAYAAFVFAWLCGWGYLMLVLWQLRPPSALTGVVFVLLMVGLVVILTSVYYPAYRSALGTNAGRLDAVTSSLEFIALILALACALLGERALVTWMLIATALLLAGDMAYMETDVPDAIPAIWQLGQFLLLAMLLTFPGRSPRDGPEASGEERAGAPARSNLSGALLLISLGCVLLLSALGLTPVHTVWKSFLSVMFVVVLVVAMVWLTDRFDETVAYLKTFTSAMMERRLHAAEWRESDRRVRTILHSTGLGSYLDYLGQAAMKLKQDILFLGPERLYPPPKPAPTDRVRCFIVMPFGPDWSNDVHRALANACRSHTVHPVRGDDLFTPTDILNDIWHSIHNAAFVIADITGRNPNVLYELGIAHTLAKPVLIISNDEGDIPIDLSTRRVILYDREGDTWTSQLQNKAERAIGEILAKYAIAASAPRPVAESAAPEPSADIGLPRDEVEGV